MALFLGLLGSSSLQSNHEETIPQIPIERYSTKCPTSTAQNYQDHEKQGKTEKLPQIMWCLR